MRGWIRFACAIAFAVAGCSSSSDTFVCSGDANCVRAGITGRCLPGGSAMYCAFTDVACPTTMLRWDSSAGDGLAKTCVAPSGGGDLAMSLDLATSGGDAGAGDDLSTSQPDLASVSDLASADLTALPHCTPLSNADNPLVISGFIKDPLSGAVANVTVQLKSFPGDTVLATSSPSASDGSFSFSYATNGKAFTGYLDFVGSTIPDTRWYPSETTFGTSITNSAFLVATPSTLNTAYQLGGATRDSAKGSLIVIAASCTGAPLSGATVSMSPAPDRIDYTSGGNPPIPSPNATATASDGMAFGFNTAGSVTVDATLNGQTFTPQTLVVPAGGLAILNAIRP